MPKRPFIPKATIRRATAQEVAGLRDILLDLSVHHNRVAEGFAGIYPVLPVDRQLAKTAEQVRLGTALVEIVRVGDAMHGFSKASFEAGHGKVDWLYLDERLRGLGYGEMLLNRMLEFLRNKGVGLVDLSVVLGNDAKRFYERYGFRVRSETLSLWLDKPGGVSEEP